MAEHVVSKATERRQHDLFWKMRQTDGQDLTHSIYLLTLKRKETWVFNDAAWDYGNSKRQ
jgi:hypothetical protein